MSVMDNWLNVSHDVKDLIKSGSTMFTRIRAALKLLPPTQPDYGHVWFNPKTQHVFFNVGDSDSDDLIQDYKDALKVKGVKKVIFTDAEAQPPKDEGPWLHVKKAVTMGSIMKPVAQAGGWTEGFPANIFGGPNPLSAMIASGALGAGLGYGAGALAEQVLPRKYFDKGKLRRTLGILGGLAGATPGFWSATVNWRNNRGITDPIGAEPNDEDRAMASKYTQASALHSLNDVLDVFYPVDSITKRENSKLAAAFGEDAGGDFVGLVDKDQFNHVVWQDPFLNIPTKSTVSGVLEGASQIAGDSLISPADIARLGVGMGSGWFSGMLVGKTLGALAGLNTDAQQSLQRAGILAGLVKNVVPILFNR